MVTNTLDDGVTWKSADYDPEMVKRFMQDSTAKSWTPDQLNDLFNVYHGDQNGNGLGVRNGQTGAWVDMAMVNTFEQWMASQQNQQANWKSYADASNSQGGREQTILAGAARTPQTILGQAAAASNTTPAVQSAAAAAPAAFGAPGSPVQPPQKQLLGNPAYANYFMSRPVLGAFGR